MSIKNRLDRLFKKHAGDSIKVKLENGDSVLLDGSELLSIFVEVHSLGWGDKEVSPETRYLVEKALPGQNKLLDQIKAMLIVYSRPRRSEEEIRRMIEAGEDPNTYQVEL